MRDHEGCRRGFYWTTKAWYNKDQNQNKINFGMYAYEGGTSGEMTVEWMELGSNQVLHLQAFDDSWAALALFKDLIDEMAEVDSENITQDEFIALLKECGFEDLTAYDNPYETDEEGDLRQELIRLEKQVKEIKEKLEK